MAGDVGEAGTTGGFHPFDVEPAHLAYTILGGFVVAFGMFSLLIREKLYLGEAPIATVFGIIFGPYVLKLFNPRAWGGDDPDTYNAVTLEVTRVVLAIGVFAIGVELPKAYMWKHWKSLFFLLVPIMTYGWFVSAAFVYALIPGLDFLSSLVVGACLTPTDPILAAAVVGGKFATKHVPAHLRHLLSAESACNDGAAFPFLFIALYLTLEKSDGKAIGEWFYITWLYEVLLGIVFGTFLGYGFRHLMKFCERKNLIDRHSYVAQYISLALLSIGATTLLGSDDLLAAFSCGTAFAWDGWFNRQTEESQFSNVIDLLFNCAAFIYIGAWIPFNDFEAPELTISVWRLIVIGILVMLFRRLPAIVLLYKWIPDVKTLREALFSGHFGPIGVGAVFISTLASTKLPKASNPPASQIELLAATIQPIVAFMVLCSIAIHGLSIPFFSLGRRVHSITYTYTWSRRQSIDPTAPEWANQVRRLPSRREDIVINHDEKDRTTPSANPTAPGERDITEKAIADSSDDSGAPSGGGSPTGTRIPVNDELAASIIPEGTTANGEEEDGFREWREGRDLIVEVQPRETEECSVKVFKDVFADEESGVLADGMAEHIRQEVDAFRQSLRKRAAALKDDVAAEIANLVATTHINPSSTSRNPPPEPTASPVEAIATSKEPGNTSATQSLIFPQSNGGNEDEWRDEPADELEDTQPTAGPSVVVAEGRHSDERSMSPHKRTRKHLFVPTKTRVGRRRDSVRRALFSGTFPKRPHTAPASSNASGEDSSPSSSTSAAASTVDLVTDEGSTRGRATTVASAIPVSRRSSMRPGGANTPRNSSPAPSRIRFADEQDQSASPTSPIPRTQSGLSHSHTHLGYTHPIPENPLLAHQHQSPTESGRVMFDLSGSRPERDRTT